MLINVVLVEILFRLSTFYAFLLYQNRALKSSEHVRNAGVDGECTMCRTTPLWPRERSCLREAFRESQQQSDVVASSGNMTKSSLWLNTAWARCSCKIEQFAPTSRLNFRIEIIPASQLLRHPCTLPGIERSRVPTTLPSSPGRRKGCTCHCG